MHVVLRTLILGLICTAFHAAEPAPRSILFIGNSLTYTNDLPAMLARLAKAGGQGDLDIGRQLVGGSTLEKHWQEGKALTEIRARPWDWIVLQDLSTQTLRKPESFAEYGQRFISEIKARHALPVLYQTWSVQGEMPTQPRISAAYADLATTHGAVLVPAGQVFATYRERHGDASLFKDNRHPIPAGTYLAACTFYVALFARNPAGLPGDPALPATVDVAELQRIAWENR